MRKKNNSFLQAPDTPQLDVKHERKESEHLLALVTTQPSLSSFAGRPALVDHTRIILLRICTNSQQGVGSPPSAVVPQRDYSRTSHNGPSEKRTTSLQRTKSVARIEIPISIIHSQPPRSGRFSIPDSGQLRRSRTDFTVQNCLYITDTAETAPTKLVFAVLRLVSCGWAAHSV